MPIVPDTKNWTWVIEKPCLECGYDSSEHPDESIADGIRANARAWPAVLARPDVRIRPDDSTWSALEYSAHVRDVLRVYLERLRLMLDTDDPLYPNWDQDQTALTERYDEQDPATVAGEIDLAAETLAAAFDGVDAAGWQRGGRRSDGASFTVSSMAKYLLHDLEHHRVDVAG